MPAVLTRSDLVGARPVWLLDLELGGRTFRVATEPIVVSSDGGALSYDGGLEDPDFHESLDRLDTTLAEASASVEVYLPIDVAALIGQGHPPAGGAAELSMVFVSPTGAVQQAWEARFSVLTGRIASPQWAHPERASGWFSCTVREEAYEDSALLIDPAARINDTTWSTSQSAVNGKVYPTVIGKPGTYTGVAGSEQNRRGAPAYVINDDGLGKATKLLVAGHAVVASHCVVFDESELGVENAVVNEVDGLGRMVATCDITAAAGIDRTDTEWWSCWGETTRDGAIQDPWATSALAGAGSVIRWALAHGNIPIDHGRWAAATLFLDRILVSTYVNDAEQSPWDFVADTLLPALPMALRRGPDGIYPVILDPEANRGDVVAVITEGPDFRRVGPLEEALDIADIVNEVTVTYAPDGDGEPQRYVTLTATPDAADPEQLTDAYAVLSRQRYDRVAAETIDVPWTYDRATAIQIGHWYLRRHAFLPRPVEYEADRSWGWIAGGDPIRMTDSGAGQSGRMGWVIERWWTGVSWGYVALYDEEPPREPRTT